MVRRFLIVLALFVASVGIQSSAEACPVRTAIRGTVSAVRAPARVVVRVASVPVRGVRWLVGR